jgi:cell shape-determining protein MreC
MNTSKAILIIIFILLLIIIFFAYTGINVSKPEQAMYTLIDKLIEINRSINRMVRNLIWNIRTGIEERFSR